MKQKNKKEDFLVCCWVHQVQVYQEIFELEKEYIEQEKVKEQQQENRRAGEGIVRAGCGNNSNNKMDF